MSTSLGSLPYTAQLTYRAFLPIVAEVNSERKDYWIVGINVTRTPDRSFYALLRYPHGRPLLRGTTRTDVEFLELRCIVGTEDVRGRSSADDGDAVCQLETDAEVEAYANAILRFGEEERRLTPEARRRLLTESAEDYQVEWTAVSVTLK